MMMKIKDFNQLKINNLKYGGNAGNKLGVVIDGDNWFLKFPKSTSQFTTKIELPYNTSYLSEYIGCHIYEILNIPVQSTQLGVYDNHFVVACKDFTGKEGQLKFEDFHSIKNTYVKGLEENLSSSSTSNSLSIELNDVETIMNNNPTFINTPKLKERFWDMFVVDALIGNTDRNNGNWGVLVNKVSDEESIAPVFDNGGAFSNNLDETKIANLLQDDSKFIQSVYYSRECFFSKDGKRINPLRYIENMQNEDCNKAVQRIVPKLNKAKIVELINSIPNEYDGKLLMSDERKDFYCRSIEYRIDKVLLPTLEKLQKEQEESKEEIEEDIDI